MPYNTDETAAVLLAAERAVDGLAEGARDRLAKGAWFVRLGAHDARVLIDAVDALRSEAAR